MNRRNWLTAIAGFVAWMVTSNRQLLVVEDITFNPVTGITPRFTKVWQATNLATEAQWRETSQC